MKIIGIDTGVNTGVAIFNITEQKFEFIGSMAIHKALKIVEAEKPALVRVEDARLYRHCGKTNPAIIQQVGSVKRDAVIWEAFLKDLSLFYEMVSPADNETKLTSAEFKQRTGWQMMTNEHSRDAGMLVWGWTQRNLENTLRGLTIGKR